MMSKMSKDSMDKESLKLSPSKRSKLRFDIPRPAKIYNIYIYKNIQFLTKKKKESEIHT